MQTAIQLDRLRRESWDFKLAQAAVSLWIWMWCYWPYSLPILVAVMLIGQLIRWAVT
jgi:hypothetical protein